MLMVENPKDRAFILTLLHSRVRDYVGIKSQINEEGRFAPLSQVCMDLVILEGGIRELYYLLTGTYCNLTLEDIITGIDEWTV